MTLVRHVLPAAAFAAIAVGVLFAQTATAAPGSEVLAPAAVPMKPGPAQTDHGAAATYARLAPGSTPAGTNDFGCAPSVAHPRPVVLAHGTDASAYSDWAGIAPRLVNAGYCVYALNYGGEPNASSYGTEDIRTSAAQFADFVQRVRRATGAPKIDIVGYSQGATVTRYYINKLGGAPNVERWVGLASPSYGGTMYGIAPAAQAIPGAVDALGNVISSAALEQMQGSSLLNELNAGSDTVPGVEYTTIGTRYDEMIQPFENVRLRGAGASNIVVQDLCPIDQTGHFNMPYDPFTQQLVLNTLDPVHTQVPQCTFVPLGTGIASVVASAHS